jgi:hypothetical protein
MSTRRYQTTANGLVYRNENGGLFQPGRMYQLPRKTEVVEVFLWLCQDVFPQCPTVNKTAWLSKVSWGFTNQVIMELKALGAVVDPETMRREKNSVLGPGQKLSTIQEMFLLCLRTLRPVHPLYNYVQELERHFSKAISHQCIADWFNKQWDHRGNLLKTNLVPLDKWKPANNVCYYKCVQKLQ